MVKHKKNSKRLSACSNIRYIDQVFSFIATLATVATVAISLFSTVVHDVCFLVYCKSTLATIKHKSTSDQIIIYYIVFNSQ